MKTKCLKLFKWNFYIFYLLSLNNKGWAFSTDIYNTKHNHNINTNNISNISNNSSYSHSKSIHQTPKPKQLIHQQPLFRHERHNSTVSTSSSVLSSSPSVFYNNFQQQHPPQELKHERQKQVHQPQQTLLHRTTAAATTKTTTPQPKFKSRDIHEAVHAFHPSNNFHLRHSLQNNYHAMGTHLKLTTARTSTTARTTALPRTTTATLQTKTTKSVAEFPFTPYKRYIDDDKRYQIHSPNNNSSYHEPNHHPHSHYQRHHQNRQGPILHKGNQTINNANIFNSSSSLEKRGSHFTTASPYSYMYFTLLKPTPLPSLSSVAIKSRPQTPTRTTAPVQIHHSLLSSWSSNDDNGGKGVTMTQRKVTNGGEFSRPPLMASPLITTVRPPPYHQSRNIIIMKPTMPSHTSQWNSELDEVHKSDDYYGFNENNDENAKDFRDSYRIEHDDALDVDEDDRIIANIRTEPDDIGDDDDDDDAVPKEDYDMDNENYADDEADESSLTKDKWEHYGTPDAVKASILQSPTNLRRHMEVQMAREHYTRMESLTRCRIPRAIVVQVGDDPSKRYTPQCTVLHRCGDESGCCHPISRTCTVKRSEEVVLYFFASILERTPYVEVLKLINHTECHCVDRITKSKGLSPLERTYIPAGTGSNDHSQLIARSQLLNCTCVQHYDVIANTTDVDDATRNTNATGCYCDCRDGNLICNELKRGIYRFSPNDRSCLASKECAVPSCTYGQYNRQTARCPTSTEAMQTTSTPRRLFFD